VNLVKTEMINEKADIQKIMIIMNAVKSLSDSEKQVIILRIIKGYSVIDVSIVLKKPEDVIKNLQFNAIKRLASQIQGI
jgi:RNA polymerase sigma-70 factor (ECF subfamily)